MGNSESKKRVYQVHGPNHDNVNAIESIFKFLPNVDYSTPSIPIPVAREIYRAITSPNIARQNGTAANAAMNVSAAAAAAALDVANKYQQDDASQTRRNLSKCREDNRQLGILVRQREAEGESIRNELDEDEEDDNVTNCPLCDVSKQDLESDRALDREIRNVFVNDVEEDELSEPKPEYNPLNELEQFIANTPGFTITDYGSV